MKSIEIVVTIPSHPAVDYPILLGDNLFDVMAWLPQMAVNQIVIITDHIVKKHYGLRLHESLQQSGYASLLLSFPAGERSKNDKTKRRLENAMLEHRCDRATLIIALGGGVVGDMAGFIAATYLRGVSYLQIPTTLLAMVDSSVGGKTGINTPYGKNLVGAIYQPMGVLVDVNCLNTLSKKHRINGLIEAIKVFLTHDAASFRHTVLYLSQMLQGDLALLQDLVMRAIKIKAGVVSRDEKERGERSVLNFGHTIGHALEKISHYRVLHGHAVAYGILVEATIAHLLGLLEQQALNDIKICMAQLGFHGKDLRSYDVAQLIDVTKGDKKNQAGQVRYVLLQDIGRVQLTDGAYVHVVTDTLVRQAFNLLISKDH